MKALIPYAGPFSETSLTNCKAASRQTAVKQGRAELERCFYVSIRVLTSLLCSAPRYMSGDTNRNNTNIKHCASSALPYFDAVCLDAAQGADNVKKLYVNKD